MNSIKLIKTEQEHSDALERLDYLMALDPKSGTQEGNELDVLIVLIQKYEDENFEIPKLDPIEVIEYFMEERGFQQKDLVGVIGDKTLVSRILNRKRKLTIEMIRKLEEFLSIPIKLLIADYDIA